MRTTLIIAALALLVAACGDGGGGNVTEFDDVPTRVEADIVAGDVRVTGNAAVDGVSVTTEISGEATPLLELAEGVLRIGDDCSSDCAVDYDVRLAGDAEVIITTGEGSVTIGDLTGAVTVDAAAGAVTLATIAGEIQVIVGEGDVLGTRLESDVATFETTDGNVDVTFDEVVATLVVAAERGDITVQLPDGSYAFDTDPVDRTELRIDATDGATNTVTLETGDGSIIVYRR